MKPWMLSQLQEDTRAQELSQRRGLQLLPARPALHKAWGQLEERGFLLVSLPAQLLGSRRGADGPAGLRAEAFHLGGGAQGRTCFLGWGEGRSGTGGCGKAPTASSWSGTASAIGHPAAFEGQRGR